MICREQERLARLVITKDDAGVSWDTLFRSQSGGGLPLVPIQWPESLRAGAESSFERAPPDREGRALRLIGGLDMSPVPHGPPAQTSKGCPVQSNTREAAVACLVIIESTSLDVVYKDTVCVELDEPYVPFFLAFREVPAYMKLFDRAKVAGYIPDVVLVDGSGVLHPRHCGSASHLGVVANIPTIGITKSLIQWESKELSTSLRLCINKRVKEELGKELKQHSVVMALPMNRHDSPPLGVVVCPFGTRKPIFVSPGHRISLHSAAQVALRCCKHRIPEPIRLADIESRRSAREMKLS